MRWEHPVKNIKILIIERGLDVKQTPFTYIFWERTSRPSKNPTTSLYYSLDGIIKIFEKSVNNVSVILDLFFTVFNFT